MSREGSKKNARVISRIKAPPVRLELVGEDELHTLVRAMVHWYDGIVYASLGVEKAMRLQLEMFRMLALFSAELADASVLSLFLFMKCRARGYTTLAWHDVSFRLDL
jgi:hypothetical protein